MENTVNHWMVKAKVSGDSAESLWNDAKEYFMWCEANPIYKQEMVRQTGATVDVEVPRPFNLAALCIHCGVTIGYINSMAKNKAAGNYHLVAQKILQVIYSQNLEYAMVGIFNPQITAKKLNLGNGDDESKAPATVNITVVECNAPPMLENEQEAKGL
jgi:hypothetical protein